MRLHLKRLILIGCAVASSVLAHATTAPIISISPGYSTIGASTSLQYTASVTGLADTSVTWLVNGVVGGNASLGTISASGLYASPAAVPGGSVLVEALASNKATMAEVYLVIEAAGPAISSVSPRPIPLGNYTITVSGSGFQPGAKVHNGTSLLPTTFVNATTLIASGYQRAGTVAILRVSNLYTLWGAPFTAPYAGTASLSPATAAVTLGKTQQFSAAGATAWSASAGKIDSTGLFTAPSSMPSTSSVLITGTGSSGSGIASVTLFPSTPQTISPTSATVLLGRTQQFSSVGASSWTSTSGTISSSGLFTAPTTLSASASVTVTASGPNGSASAPITLAAPQTISPATASVTVGQTQQFTSNGATSWSATAGSISSSGLYTPPSTLPASASAMVTATGPNGSASASVALVARPAQTISPLSATVGLGLSQQFTSVGATSWSASAGSISTAGLYVAPATMPSSPTVILTATGPGGSANSTVTLTSPAAITVTPAAASIGLGKSQQFTAPGATTWHTEVGSITSTGLYTAPSTMPASSTTAILASGPSGSALAAVTFIATATQTITPATVSVTLGQTQQFISAGATSWSASAGTISSTGLYVAPTAMPATTTVLVSATGPIGAATAVIALSSPAGQVISPSSVSLVVGQTQQFTSSGATNWTASVGTITSAGLYTAPTTLTTVTTSAITATGPLGTATATAMLVAATAPSGHVSITTQAPPYGWQLIPGATRRIHATVANGSTNEVKWTYATSGGATATLTPAPSPSILGAFVDVTLGPVGSACTDTGTAINPVFSSAATVTLTATSVDDPTQSTTVPLRVCSPQVQVFVSPFNVRLYAGQTTNLQSWVWGTANDNVVWTIAQPQGGNGTLIAPPAGGSANTNRDAVFSATVAGNYTVTASSAANPGVSASATISVDGAPMPSYAATPNHTAPVDCSVDPTQAGKTYDVGPGHPYAMLADAYVAIGSNTLTPGTTIRLFNADTTGTNPTRYHEYLRLDGQGTQTAPIRVVGCSDSVGNLPILDASNATSYSPTDNSVPAQIAGLYQIGFHHSNGFAVYPTITSPSYIIIEGLAFRNAYPTTGSSSNYYYAPGSSTATQWGKAASCIRPYEGNHITIRGNDMQDCSFGVLADFNGNNGWGGFFGDFDMEGNYFTNIGAANQSEHMAYVQGFRQVIQGNVFDQLKSVSAAGELKMRGVAEVVRYNFFNTSTNTRTIDFVEEQDSNEYMSFLGYYYTPSGSTSFHSVYPNDGYTPDMIAAADEAWHKAYVYGNIVNFGPNTPSSAAPVHFFGDQGSYSDPNTNPPVRVGDLFDYSNTFYSVGGGSSAPPNFNFVDTMENKDNQIRWEWPSLTIANNAIYTGPLNTVAGQGFQWSTIRSDTYTFGSNWISSNWGTNSLACTSGSCWAGTGWPYYQETTQYMDGGNLAAHVSGFSNVVIGGSTIPFSTSTFIPTAGGGLVGAGTALPSTVSNMPVRFQISAPGFALTPRLNPLTLGAHD